MLRPRGGRRPFVALFEGFEQIGEAPPAIVASCTEEVFQIDVKALGALWSTPRTTPGGGSRLRSASATGRVVGAAVAIVEFPLLRIVQHVESFLHTLEFLFGLGIPLIEIWVMLAGHLAIGRADFVCRCLAAHAQRVVVIFCHTLKTTQNARNRKSQRLHSTHRHRDG